MKRIACLVWCLCITMGLCSCFSKSGYDTKINLYFKNALTNELSVEKVKYDSSQNTVDMANFAMEMLKKGPTDEDNVKVIPDSCILGKVSVKNEVATIDVSKEFTSLTGTDELLARFSVVRTLCDIPGISAVQITVEGAPLVSNATGIEVGILSKKDIVIDIDTNADVSVKNDTTTILLYFANADATTLKSENRKVETTDTISIERTIINELLKGPSSPELVKVIPDGVKLQNIETKDGVCYVTFSGEFVSKFSGGSNTGMLIVYSIVNSLCNLENIDSVQILIDGEKGAEFGDFVFDEPIGPKQIVVEKN